MSILFDANFKYQQCIFRSFSEKAWLNITTPDVCILYVAQLTTFTLEERYDKPLKIFKSQEARNSFPSEDSVLKSKYRNKHNDLIFARNH